MVQLRPGRLAPGPAARVAPRRYRRDFTRVSGGCPFAPKATGNIATEDLVYLLRGLGVETGVDLDRLIAISHWLGEQLGKEMPGMVARAGDYPVRHA